jgi:hypothetical protein
MHDTYIKMGIKWILTTFVPFHPCIQEIKVYLTILQQLQVCNINTQISSMRMSVTQTDVSEAQLPCSAKRHRILFPRAAGLVQSCISHPVPFTGPPLLRLCSSAVNTSPRLVFPSPVSRDSNIFSCLCRTSTVPFCYTVCYFIIHLATPSDSPHLTQGGFYMWTSVTEIEFFANHLRKATVSLIILPIYLSFHWSALNKTPARVFVKFHILGFLLKLTTHNTLTEIWHVTVRIWYSLWFSWRYELSRRNSSREEHNNRAWSMVCLLLRYREILQRMLYKTMKDTF